MRLLRTQLNLAPPSPRSSHSSQTPKYQSIVSSLAMSTPSKLLDLPLEIRHRIYFHLLPHGVEINIVRDNIDGPLKTGLSRVCQAIFHEVFQYYYSVNTFVLDLTKRAYAPSRFVNGTKGTLKYIRRVHNLRLAIGDELAPNDDSCVISEYAREQLDWFLTVLAEANGNRGGLWLRNLNVLDCCENTVSKEATKELLQRGETRRKLLVSLLEPIRSRIRCGLSIESRARSKVVSKYGCLAVSKDTRGIFKDLEMSGLANPFRKPTAPPTWDTVLGVSHISPSNSLSYSNPFQSVPN